MVALLRLPYALSADCAWVGLRAEKATTHFGSYHYYSAIPQIEIFPTTVKDLCQRVGPDMAPMIRSHCLCGK